VAVDDGSKMDGEGEREREGERRDCDGGTMSGDVVARDTWPPILCAR